MVHRHKCIAWYLCMVPEGAQHPRMSENISDNAWVPVRQLICYTSRTLKHCPKLCSVPQIYFCIHSIVHGIVVGYSNKCNSIVNPDCRHMWRKYNYILLQAGCQDLRKLFTLLIRMMPDIPLSNEDSRNYFALVWLVGVHVMTVSL